MNKISSVDDTKNQFRYSESSLNYLSVTLSRIFSILPYSPLKLDPKLSHIPSWLILVHIKQRKRRVQILVIIIIIIIINQDILKSEIY